ncbi:MAG: murein transglycosylase A [Alphaproteobacteria bacterium]
MTEESRARPFPLLLLVLLLGAVAIAYFLLARTPPEKDDTGVFAAKPVTYDALDGWAGDYHALALQTFLTSCARLDPQPVDRSMGGAGFAGAIGDWVPLCRAADKLPKDDHGAARAFFEGSFTPVAIFEGNDPEGLFTGYYVPVVDGRLKPDERFNIPLHARPSELVMVDLGVFRESLKGQRIAGHVENGTLVPYHERGDIAAGILEGRDLEVVWLDDAFEAFSMQIQGSGVVRLEDGSMLRLGYAAQNGHPYTSVGRLLVERGEMTLDQASMQSIKAWMEANPEKGRSLMDENASYVFFQKQERDGAIGAQNVILTAGRSLAVDRKYMPLGVPLWVEIDGGQERRIKRLMVAQDTGGAIIGPVRGDFFWGEGDEAGQVAGRMKDRGRYYVLLPNAVAARLSVL